MKHGMRDGLLRERSRDAGTRNVAGALRRRRCWQVCDLRDEIEG